MKKTKDLFKKIKRYQRNISLNGAQCAPALWADVNGRGVTG